MRPRMEGNQMFTIFAPERHKKAEGSKQSTDGRRQAAESGRQTGDGSKQNPPNQ
jgi:hypothetical protein